MSDEQAPTLEELESWLLWEFVQDSNRDFLSPLDCEAFLAEVQLKLLTPCQVHEHLYLSYPSFKEKFCSPNQL